MLRPAASQWLQLPKFIPLVLRFHKKRAKGLVQSRRSGSRLYFGLSKPAMTEYSFPDGFRVDVPGGAALSLGGLFTSRGYVAIESAVGSMGLSCYLVIGSPSRAV